MYSVLTCPCCGYKTISDEHDICDICFWQYDRYQNRHPDDAGGPNLTSLRQAQKNFATFGAASEKERRLTRSPTQDDVKDASWVPMEP